MPRCRAAAALAAGSLSPASGDDPSLEFELELLESPESGEPLPWLELLEAPELPASCKPPGVAGWEAAGGAPSSPGKGKRLLAGLELGSPEVELPAFELPEVVAPGAGVPPPPGAGLPLLVAGSGLAGMSPALDSPG